jgi:ABC-type polysaccharide/polyol phosphate transport system ATPase subunit
LVAFSGLTATVSHTEQAGVETLATGPPAIAVSGLSKAFRLPHQRYSTLKERALHPLRSTTYDVLQAVDDVSFETAQGEFFGIVGRNGSGKSTLLKCIAGIYDIDAGAIRLDGRVAPFIELGVGFNPELSARDNVLLNAIMLGLTRRQARERFDEIIAFAELEEFVDLKLKNYSSGMHVRLAFSIAVQVDADVLLIDEVLAVGDASFQQKCFDKFHELKDGGRTIVLVTHDMGAVQRFCDRAMLMERGRVLSVGEPEAIARQYMEVNFGRSAHAVDAVERRYASDRGAEIVDAWFESPDGERVVSIAQGESCRICFEVAMRETLVDPVFAVHLRNDVRQTIFATSSDGQVGDTGTFPAGELARVRIEFQNWLAPSRYSLTPSIIRAGAIPGSVETIDVREDVTHLLVHGARVTGGVADLPHGFVVERP